MNWEEYCLSKKEDLQKMFPNENIDNPKTLSEKLQWLKIYDSTYLKAFCADKITVRDYCKEKLGIDLCIPLLKIYNKPEEIEWNILPNQFVIKCNHGSAMNIIVKDKKTVKKDNINKTLNKWLSIKYGDLSYELFYNLIKPKIIIEPYLEDKENGALTDYKFLCFNGEPKYCQVINDRNTKDFHLNYYDMNFNFVDISLTDVPNNKNFLDKKPSQFELMKKYAKTLAQDFNFVRVDFYQINDVVYLSELTFFPAAGFFKYKDEKIDLMLGNMLNLN